MPVLSDRVGLKHNVPQGTYFVMIDISDFLALPQFKGWTDLQFCEWMIREVGVAAVPGSSFFREPVNHLIRLHFAKNDDTLNEALNRLEKIQKQTGLDVRVFEDALTFKIALMVADHMKFIENRK